MSKQIVFFFCLLLDLPCDKTDDTLQQKYSAELADIFALFSKITFDEIVPNERMKITYCRLAKVSKLLTELKWK